MRITDIMDTSIFTESKRGRKSLLQRAVYDQRRQEFVNAILEIRSTLDFEVSARGWCYLLESHGLNKGNFDKAEKVITDCRRSGLLPLDICAKDETRKPENIIILDDPDIVNEAESRVEYVMENASKDYNPIHPQDNQDYYVEMLVEKIDLKGIFAPVCQKYGIPYANAKGNADLNSRAAILKRFQDWESKGKRCVLLYCGDHDPGGLEISEFLKKNLQDLESAGCWFSNDLIIDRFGLNYDFIMANNLTWIENLETGSGKDLSNPKHHDYLQDYVQNYLTEYGPRKVEANALVTKVPEARKLCEAAILKYINPDRLVKYNHGINSLRDKLQEEIIKQVTEFNKH
ncbi:hypothetical protein ES705_15667 [subsurface metagenome]